MDFIKKNLSGILVCFIIAVPAWLLGKAFPVIGGPVIAILTGMLITLIWTDKGKAEAGIKWTSKIILQTAVVLLGFGMNLGVIMKTGKQSLPIIICTISTSLIIAWLLHRIINVPSNTAILVGVGSSTSLLLYDSLYLGTSSALTQRAVLPSDCSPEQQLMTLLL